MAIVRRRTARVIPVSAQGRALLLRGHDPRRPEAAYWFTIGGGIEPGETDGQAVVRELKEETGIEIDEGSLSDPFYRGRHAYSYDGVDYVASSTFFTIMLDEQTAVRPAGVAGEVITAAKWWSPQDVTRIPVSNPRIPWIVASAVESVIGGSGAGRVS